ncbi:hypothetical protein HMPREF2628_03240 [Streptococcus sp. HMSC063B03]|uniref:YwqH-like family protein n=1 Tax=Streptococcus sp. HMSC063B03 TaxID=1715107 RepID=UPI0008A8BD8C|nr:DUF5082 family protein [Streptococcus sp. HMSC063B03]OHP90800.1 hypothetical protein HMPREF2628_03240 [Streptococcus sp. HMSC063B03]
MGRYDSAIANCHAQIRWIRLDIRTYEDKIRRLESANDRIQSQMDVVSKNKTSASDLNKHSTTDFKGTRREDFDKTLAGISDAITTWLTDTEMNRKSIRFKISEYNGNIEDCQKKINSLNSQIEYYHRLNWEED